jgi:hypothetical protein
MSTEDAQVVVRDNPDEERYGLLVDDRLVGEIQYHQRRSSDRIAFIHTEVSPELEGHGLANSSSRPRWTTFAPMGCTSYRSARLCARSCNAILSTRISSCPIRRVPH